MRLPWLKVQQNAFTKAEDLAALLGIEVDAALGKVLLLWRWSIDRVRDEDIPDGVILGEQADLLVANACRWKGEPKAFVDALEAAGFIERNAVTRDVTRTSTRPPQTAPLRIRGASVYAEAISKRIGAADRKRRERAAEKEALEARKRKRTSVTRDITRTSEGRHADVLSTSRQQTQPPVGRSVVSGSHTFSNPTDRPSPETAPSAGTKGPAMASMANAPKRSVDVGALRRQKRLAAKSAKSSYSVTVESEPLEDELAALWELAGVAPEAAAIEHGAAIEALGALRRRFSAAAVLGGFADFLRDVSIREKRLMPFLLSGNLHRARCQRAESLPPRHEGPACACCGRTGHLELWDGERACEGCWYGFIQSGGDGRVAWAKWVAERES